MTLRVAILHSLSLASEKGVPEFALKIEARLRTGRTPGETDWAAEVTTLVERGWVTRTTDQLTDDTGLVITAAGKKALNQLG